MGTTEEGTKGYGEGSKDGVGTKREERGPRQVSDRTRITDETRRGLGVVEVAPSSRVKYLSF